jgi:aminopeptidase
MKRDSDLLNRYASLIVNYSLDLKKGERVLVRSTTLAGDFLGEIQKEILQAGAIPEFKIGFNDTERIFFDYADDTALKDVSPIDRYVYENFDALLSIRAPFNLKNLQSVDSVKKRIRQESQAELSEIFSRRTAAGALKWSLCQYPTDAGAQESGMSLQEYREFIFSSCFLFDDDPVMQWKNVSAAQQRITDYLNKRKNIHYKSDDVDIRFSANGRIWINSDGRHNMPSGEVFTTPVEDSVNGRVRFSYPAIYMGEEVDGIELTFKDGAVTEYSARKGGKLLGELLSIAGANRLGEAAVGMNYGIKRFTKNILFDEKIGGTIHLALGDSYPETNGKNRSSVHWDLIADMTRNSSITADGEVVYKDGKFII